VGGFGQEPLGALEVLDIRAKVWTVVKQDFPPHAYHGMTVSGTELLVFGGFGDEGDGGGAGALIRNKCFIAALRLGYVVVVSATEEIGAMGCEIESR
jgi:hypothetical protein